MPQILENKNRKKILRNIGHLFLVQGINYLFPLLTLPYLTYKLGIDGFGIYAFAQVIVQYFQVFTEYGFNLTATRKIATLQNSKEKIAELFWSVLIVKVALGIIVTIVGGVLLIVLVADKKIQLLYVYSSLSIWGSIFFPLWYFQGIESMRKIAWINLVSKLAGVGLLFVIVRGKDDVDLAGLAQAVPSVFSALLACWIIYRSKEISRINTKWREIKLELIDGRHIFYTSLFSTVLSNSGVFFLGLYHNSQIVGIYAASEKIVKAAVGFFSPITQAIYPNSAKAFSRSPHEGFRTVKAIGFYVVVLAAVGAMCLWFFSPYVAIFFHWQDVRHVYVMQLLAPWLFLGVVNNILGVQILTAMGDGHMYSRLFMLVSILSIVMLVVGVPKYGITSVLATMNIAEGILTVLLIVAVSQKWKLG